MSMNKKVDKFLREVGLKETIDPKLNLYICLRSELDDELMYWKRLLADKRLEVLNLFFDEKDGDLIKRKGFNQVLAHYVEYDNAELLVKNLEALSLDEIEARVIRHMFNKYASSTIEIIEERENALLEKHIAEICDSNKNYTYDAGAFDQQKLNKILMYKAKFEMMWHKQYIG